MGGEVGCASECWTDWSVLCVGGVGGCFSSVQRLLFSTVLAAGEIAHVVIGSGTSPETMKMQRLLSPALVLQLKLGGNNGVTSSVTFPDTFLEAFGINLQSRDVKVR